MSPFHFIPQTKLKHTLTRGGGSIVQYAFYTGVCMIFDNLSSWHLFLPIGLLVLNWYWRDFRASCWLRLPYSSGSLPLRMQISVTHLQNNIFKNNFNQNWQQCLALTLLLQNKSVWLSLFYLMKSINAQHDIFGNFNFLLHSVLETYTLTTISLTPQCTCYG